MVPERVVETFSLVTKMILAAEFLSFPSHLHSIFEVDFSIGLHIIRNYQVRDIRAVQLLKHFTTGTVYLTCIIFMSFVGTGVILIELIVIKFMTISTSYNVMKWVFSFNIHEDDSIVNRFLFSYDLFKALWTLGALLACVEFFFPRKMSTLVALGNWYSGMLKASLVRWLIVVFSSVLLHLGFHTSVVMFF